MSRRDQEDSRRKQLIDTTIHVMAQVGFNATTLGLIGKHAGVSAGLVAHYFGDKDGLLEATLRSLASRLSRAAAARMRNARTPRERLQAVVDANLAPEEMDSQTSAVWLAFWGQAIHSDRLKRVQRIYQLRVLSNLRHALRSMTTAAEAERLAVIIAAIIDGLWLRTTLAAAWSPADSEAARRIAAGFIDTQLPVSPEGPTMSHVPATSSGKPPRIANWINGAYRPNPAAETFVTRNPATGAVLAEIEIADAAALDAAVTAARAGQKVWARMTGMERGRVLRRVADLLRAKNDDLARLETQDTGKPIQETDVVDVISGADCIEYFAGLAGGITGESVDLGPNAMGYTRREPLGIVAGIGAWNYPIQIACWKSAPALACGNAMIFKPSELTPLTAFKLAEIMTEAGVPDGVFNVLPGDGRTGSLLVAHPAIAKISLTGSVPTGKKVMAAAAETLKHVTLELGGKSPIIVFEDADIESAIGGAMLGNFYSAGEVCSNGTRVFVHRSIKDRFIARLLERTAKIRIGDPLDPETQMGALISEPHMQKVLGYIQRGVAEGAKLLCGGTRVTEGALAAGNFVSPAIFDATSDDVTIVREEIFGPVLTILTFDTEAEVVARANDTEFGLGAGIFTQDITRAHRVIAELQAGTCWINTYNITPIELPFGGYKQSGLGRENSRAALDHYSQIKSVYVALTPVESPY
ncbi:betaine-aldehyde dehydrogenase [Acidisoma silvae]|uniref:betaine-aldehyde dehydrogenase n=1 Tax=Acidisoma silvae TaxID=2802396 RepID=UPI001D09DD52|nr:betaine-aldehyde dehydrogenase [Acidisoma silvae]